LKAIPTWEQRKLSELMTFSNGINAPKENYGKGRKMISVMDILQEAPIKYENIRSSVKVDEKIEVKNKVENGDLVFVRSSEVREEVGWAKAYLEEKYALYSGFSIRGKKQNEFNSHFIELTLNSVNRKQLERKAGGSTRFNVSQNILNNVEIFSPTIEEQNTIDKLFKVFNDAITLHQEKLSKLQSLKKAALQSLFPQKNEKEPKVRFANFKEIWKQYKLKDVIESELKGKAKAKDKTNDCKNVYLETNYLNGGEVSYVDVPNDVDEDDVLILWDGSQAGTVYHGYKGALGSTLKAYKPKESGEFMFQYLKKNQQKIYDNYRTPNIPHVVKTFTEDFRIKSTSIIEQRKISSFFKQLDSTINFYQDKLEKLQLLKKAFLQKMFI